MNADMSMCAFGHMDCEGCLNLLAFVRICFQIVVVASEVRYSGQVVITTKNYGREFSALDRVTSNRIAIIVFGVAILYLRMNFEGEYFFKRPDNVNPTSKQKRSQHIGSIIAISAVVAVLIYAAILYTVTGRLD